MSALIRYFHQKQNVIKYLAPSAAPPLTISPCGRWNSGLGIGLGILD